MRTLTNKRGFTLLELLVVVLIIGILASIALPQYQKAVDKSRAARNYVAMKPVLQATTACYLATGETCAQENLDIDVPECQPISERYGCLWDTGGGTSHVKINFYDGESPSKAPAFVLGLTHDGHRFCCGREGRNVCPKYGFPHIDTSLLYDCGVVYVDYKPVAGNGQIGDKVKEPIIVIEDPAKKALFDDGDAKKK